MPVPKKSIRPKNNPNQAAPKVAKPTPKPLPIKPVQTASVSLETGTKEIPRDDLPDNYKQVNVRLGKLTGDDLDKISNRIIHIQSATKTKCYLDTSDASIAIYGVEWSVWQAEAQLTQLLDEARRLKAKGQPLDLIPEAATLLGMTMAADRKDGACMFEVDRRIISSFKASDLQDGIRAFVGGHFGPKVDFKSPNIVYYYGKSLNQLNVATNLLNKWQEELLDTLEREEGQTSPAKEAEETGSATDLPARRQDEKVGPVKIKSDEKGAAKHNQQVLETPHIQPATLIPPSGTSTSKVAAPKQGKPAIPDFVDILSHSSGSPPQSEAGTEATPPIGDTFPAVKQILLHRQVLEKLQYSRPDEHARLLEGLPGELEKKFNGRIKFQWIQKKWAMKIRGEKVQGALEQAEKAYQAEYKRLKDLAATIHLPAKNKTAAIAPEPTKKHGNAERTSTQQGKENLDVAKGRGNDVTAESGDEDFALDLGQGKTNKPKEEPMKAPADVQAQRSDSTKLFMQQILGQTKAPVAAPAVQPASKPSKLRIDPAIKHVQTKQADEWDVDSPVGSVEQSTPLPAVVLSTSVRPEGGQEVKKDDAKPVSDTLMDESKKVVMPQKLFQQAIRSVENEQKVHPVPALTPGAARTGSSSAKVDAAGKEDGNGTAPEHSQPKSHKPKPPPIETEAPKTIPKTSNESPTKIYASEDFDNNLFAVDQRQSTTLQMGPKLSLVPESELERVAKRIVQLGKDCGVDVKISDRKLVLLRADNPDVVKQCVQRIEAYLMGVTDGVVGKEKEPFDTKPSTSTTCNAPAGRTASPNKDRSPERQALSVSRPKAYNPYSMPPPQAQYYPPPMPGYGPQMGYGYNPYGAAPAAGAAGQGPAGYWNWWGYGPPPPSPGYQGYQQGYPHQGYNGYHGQGFPSHGYPTGYGGEYPGGSGRR